MFGLIGRLEATPGSRDTLIGILLGGVKQMPGCLSYVVATEPDNADVIWITEVWKDAESHGASMSLPRVQEAMLKGKPLIARFGPMTKTEPVGGHGLGS